MKLILELSGSQVVALFDILKITREDMEKVEPGTFCKNDRRLDYAYRILQTRYILGMTNQFSACLDEQSLVP